MGWSVAYEYQRCQRTESISGDKNGSLLTRSVASVLAEDSMEAFD